jgi:hypothetical protein
MRMRMWLVALLAALAGCTHNTTLVRRGPGDGRVIYRLSEEQAFTIARGVFAELLPDRKLFDIIGNRRGYWTTYRFGIDRYTQRVLVVPAVGTDASGHEVRGYWFDVSGKGTAIIAGGAKNRALYHRLQEAADATGSAVIVTNVREGKYDTDGRAYLAGGQRPDSISAAGPPTASSSATSASTVERLRQLKAMRDEGLISDSEYEAKRRQLLDRM